MGAKLAHPEKLCINMWGDAAIGMTGMDFETCVRCQHPDPVDPVQQLLHGHGVQGDGLSKEKYKLDGHLGQLLGVRARPSAATRRRITEPSQVVHALLEGIAATKAGKPALLEFITTQDKVYSTHRDTYGS